MLVQRAQAGERGAFRELYERHHKRAFAVAYGVLKNKQDALDVVQESFVKVHRHLEGFQGSSSFYTWLYRIVMNLAIDQLRRRKTARPVSYDDAIDRESDRIDDAILPRMVDSNPRKAVIRRELMARVEEALATLPEYHRQVIVLREIEGLSYEEMAEALEVPKGTIMSRLFHARRKMQVALADYADGVDLDVEE
ncbi:MAG: sigma-70 family RNA polymerase sigma factor [Myxococcota bacterium]|nr:sigma-70 family RNA polymerase sigma factor [Myxococcota bacterium]